MNTRIPKRIKTVHTAALITALLAASGVAQAGHGRGDRDGFNSRARVVSSTPIYEAINEPRRECWTETTGYDTRSYRDGNNTGSTIIGAIAGGLLGSTVGKGNGKVAAAAVGAATGAIVGNRWNNGDARYESSPRQVERCRTENNYRQVVTGYDVRYRFQGREYTTRMPYDPGHWVNMDVAFNVSEYQRPDHWRDDDRHYGKRYERDDD